MKETVANLEARLALIDRIRKVEQSLARDEQAREAARLVRGRSHDLGNAIQIVRLASIEIEKRGGEGIADLVTDLRNAAESATTTLTELIAIAKPGPRVVEGVAIAPAVREAVALAQPAIAAEIDLRIELADMVKTPVPADELEAIVLAGLLDAARATKLGLYLRARAIEGKPWLELIRIDDRKDASDGDFSAAFEPFSTPGPGLHLVRTLAERCGGEASLSPGRGGLELVVALPVAPGQSS